MRAGSLLLFALVASQVPSSVDAKTGRCVLQVNKRTYLNKPCNVMKTDRQGSFTIGVGNDKREKYFAYVNMEDDGAHGYWNETPDASHAHTSLGILKRDGACWKNSNARVCAYR